MDLDFVESDCLHYQENELQPNQPAKLIQEILHLRKLVVGYNNFSIFSTENGDGPLAISKNDLHFGVWSDGLVVMDILRRVIRVWCRLWRGTHTQTHPGFVDLNILDLRILAAPGGK